jgi:hypothetical protein
MWGSKSNKKVIGTGVSHFIVASDVPKINEEIEKRIELNTGLTTSHYKGVAVKKDDSTFDIEIFGNTIMHGAERIAAGMVIDISEES